MPEVSVILNCYNQGQYVADAVESVLGQTYGDLELIAIDNGSTDDTRGVLEQYTSDPRMRLFAHQDNRPVSKRFNEGVSAARGQYISFLYSDDYYLPAKLERQLQALKAAGADYGVVYGPARGFNEITRRTFAYPSMQVSGSILGDMLTCWERGFIDMVSPLTRRECFLRYPFYEDVFAEGEAVFLRIAMGYRFMYLPEELAVLRDHGGNAGKAVKKNTEISMLCLDRLERHPDFPSTLRGALLAYRSGVLRNHAWQTIRLDGDIKWARSTYRRAIRVNWRELFHPRTGAGIILSMFPVRLRRRINALGHVVRRDPRNSVMVQGYGGASQDVHGQNPPGGSI